jgi:hypothetical protein
MTIPIYLHFYVLIGSLAIIGIILFGLRNALTNAAWPERDRVVAFGSTAMVLIGWFLVAMALGLAGAYRRA